MTAQTLDGRELSKKIRFEIKNEVAQFETEYDVTPTLALVRAGEDPASVSYAGIAIVEPDHISAGIGQGFADVIVGLIGCR